MAEPSIRESLEASIQQLETGEAPEAPEVEAPVEIPEGDDQLEPVEALETSPPPAKAPPPAPKAAKPSTASQTPPEPVKKPAATPAKPLQPEEAPQPQRQKPPSTWKAQAREKFDALDPAIKAEVFRREKEIAQGFNEIANERKFNQQVRQLYGNYQHIIAAEGGDPLKFTNDLMTTAAALYHGSPQQKIQVVANMIKTFGIDLGGLDNHLAEMVRGGMPVNGNGQADAATFIRNEIQTALQPVFQNYNNRSQAEQDRINSDIDKFANDPTNEFFDDVKDTMADIMEASHRRGEKLSLQTAYNRAIMAHSDIADVIAERAVRSKAEAASKAAVAAKRRTVSVTGSPSKEVAAGDRQRTLREDLEAAMELHSST